MLPIDSSREKITCTKRHSLIIDSQESFFELEGSYFDNTSVLSLPTESQEPPLNVLQQIERWEQRLRYYNINPASVIYNNRVPERSQSSLSFMNETKSANAITNKLLEQHGIVQTMRKLSRTDDTIKLSDTIKKRRSRSADSRFSPGLSIASESYRKLAKDPIEMPTTSRRSREKINSHISQVPAPDPEIKIQVNGEGIDIQDV